MHDVWVETSNQKMFCVYEKEYCMQFEMLYDYESTAVDIGTLQYIN